jgi:hypothetical protein
MAAITGTDDGTIGYAVQGTDTAGTTQKAPDGKQDFAGVSGHSTNWYGVRAGSTGGVGVFGASSTNTGVFGKNGAGSGIVQVVGGVVGDTDNGCGVLGQSLTSDGVRGVNNGNGAAIRGICQTTGGLAGKFDGSVLVLGGLSAGSTVQGTNGAGSGIVTQFGGGVKGDSDNGWGVIGTSWTYDGVRGENNGNGAAIRGVCHSSGGNAGVFEGNVVVIGNTTVGATLSAATASVSLGLSVGQNLQGNTARFAGDVSVGGTLQVTTDIILAGADCAEEFDLAGNGGAEPGSVMVIDGETAGLAACSRAYDTCAAGVVSGAGSFRPGVTLGRVAEASCQRAAIALVGKVFCKVTAANGSIRVGDLLTTSAEAGHAMRVSDVARATGAIIGKALGRLEGGTGLIPILIALQ